MREGYIYDAQNCLQGMQEIYKDIRIIKRMGDALWLLELQYRVKMVLATNGEDFD